jgi:predicted N-acetyltransferase YhbS
MITREAISYSIEPTVSTQEVIAVFDSSGIKRPTSEPERIAKMIAHGNLNICARHEGKLVGYARSLTDFAFCCYLSDLAVAKEYQRLGIGKELIRRTHQAIGKDSMLLLLAAQTAEGYYPHVGFEAVPNGWIIHRKG